MGLKAYTPEDLDNLPDFSIVVVGNGQPVTGPSGKVYSAYLGIQKVAGRWMASGISGSFASSAVRAESYPAEIVFVPPPTT